MEDLKTIVNFRDLLRAELTELLKQYDYQLTFDNKHEDQNKSENWVFRLQYSGKKKVEIHNDDWRDYVEYFFVKIDGKELLTINLKNCETIENAFERIKTILIENIK